MCEEPLYKQVYWFIYGEVENVKALSVRCPLLDLVSLVRFLPS